MISNFYSLVATTAKETKSIRIVLVFAAVFALWLFMLWVEYGKKK